MESIKITSDMGRLEFVVLCSFLFAAVNCNVLKREKRDKGNAIF